MRKKIASILVILALLTPTITIFGELRCHAFAADQVHSKFQNEIQTYKRLPADINGDGIVDYEDIKIAVLAFGAKLGNERYDPIVDLNNDSRINMKDVASVIKDFGKTNYRLTINVCGQGTTDPRPGVYGYTGGTPVIITAIAIPTFGWPFDYWSGDATGTENPITVTMDSHKNITAHFTGLRPIRYVLATAVKVC